jgi:hypothetical protein
MIKFRMNTIAMTTSVTPTLNAKVNFIDARFIGALCVRNPSNRDSTLFLIFCSKV